MCVHSCGFDGEAGPAGLPGADPAAQAQGGHPERRHGCSEPAQAVCHHVLWRQRGWQIYQPCKGDLDGLWCRLRLVLDDIDGGTSKHLLSVAKISTE